MSDITMQVPRLFGAWLKERRLKHSLTIEKLAEVIGSEPVHINRLEYGATEPTLSQLWKIADLFHVEPWILLIDLMSTWRLEPDDKVILKTRVHDFNRIYRLGYHKDVWDFRELTRTYDTPNQATDWARALNITRRQNELPPIDAILMYVRLGYVAVQP